jgi:hypothetical protein
VSSRLPGGTAGRIRKALGSFSYLLATLLLYFLVVPLAPSGSPQTAAEVIGLSAVLLASIYALHGSRRALMIGIAVVVPAITGKWLSFLTGHGLLFSVSRLLAIVLFVLTTWNIIRYLATEREVTVDTLYGSVSAYLLIGLFFGTAYTIMESVSPGSFTNLPVSTDGVTGVALQTSVALDYYSLVTLTSLGYGDITPISQLARSAAILEAVLGQFYLAVLVARLVGLFMASRPPAKS